jgi:hypothetical protein
MKLLDTRSMQVDDVESTIQKEVPPNVNGTSSA